MLGFLVATIVLVDCVAGKLVSAESGRRLMINPSSPRNDAKMEINREHPRERSQTFCLYEHKKSSSEHRRGSFVGRRNSSRNSCPKIQRHDG
jgi:hypothetical protein